MSVLDFGVPGSADGGHQIDGGQTLQIVTLVELSSTYLSALLLLDVVPTLTTAHNGSLQGGPRKLIGQVLGHRAQVGVSRCLDRIGTRSSSRVISALEVD